MLEFYKTENQITKKLYQPEPGCWINVVDPMREEIDYLTHVVGVLPEFIKSSLDEEESSHIDYDDDTNQTLIMFDYPYYDNTADFYYTLPIGFVFMDGYIISISLHENDDIQNIELGNFKGFDSEKKNDMFFQVSLRVFQRYLVYLRQIDRMTSQIEDRLRESMQNKELMGMLSLRKSLVYFSTSLKSDEMTFKRIRRGRYLHLEEEDVDYLEDIFIELQQAIEMCDIYKDVLNGTMDTFSNVISNNLDDSMKLLTIITIAMEVPNMVYGFYGMNVVGLPIAVAWFPFILSIVLALAVWKIFKIGLK